MNLNCSVDIRPGDRVACQKSPCGKVHLTLSTPSPFFKAAASCLNVRMDLEVAREMHAALAKVLFPGPSDLEQALDRLGDAVAEGAPTKTAERGRLAAFRLAD